MQATVKFNEIKAEIIANLKKATANIWLAVAWLTDEDIIRVLSQLQEKGIKVQILICDSTENFKNTKQFAAFLRFGGGMAIATKPFMHHKFCIIDDHTILNGSYNWSYPAQRNNENLMILMLDIDIREDKLVLLQFQSEFIKLYKAATQITNVNELPIYRQQGREMAVILAGLEELEIDLRQQFENEVHQSINISRKIGIQLFYTSLLERMQADGGGVNFAKRLINEEMQTRVMKPGFKKLEEHDPPRIDLSIEYLIAKPQYAALFTTEEINFCTRLMGSYGMHPV